MKTLAELSLYHQWDRLCEKVVKNKFQEHIKENIGEDQAEFKARRSCREKNYNL